MQPNLHKLIANYEGRTVLTVKQTTFCNTHDIISCNHNPNRLEPAISFVLWVTKRRLIEETISEQEAQLPHDRADLWGHDMDLRVFVKFSIESLMTIFQFGKLDKKKKTS